MKQLCIVSPRSTDYFFYCFIDAYKDIVLLTGDWLYEDDFYPGF